MDAKHLSIFLLKVICDASSRLVIFGAWMFTYNSWVFSTNLTVAYFYGMLALMLMVNVTFCCLEKERIWSLRNLIGKKQYDQAKIQNQVIPYFQRHSPKQLDDNSQFQPL